jgi:hypothetical protein
MKKSLCLLSAAAMFCISAQAQTNPVVFPPSQIAVFKAGTSDTNWPMVTARVAPCFVQAFSVSTANQSSTNPLVSVAMSTNSSVPGSVWINHHAGSEGGGLSRSKDRQFLCLEGYVGNILSPTSAKPSTDGTVNRGIVTLDAFTNAISVYQSVNTWFGLPVGAAPGTQDNPTGIASLDGTNFWGTGNFAGISGELDGTLFYNPNVNGGAPVEVQNYLQAAGEARIIGGSLLVATKSATGVASGLYNFVDPASGQEVPLPWSPAAQNPYYNFTFTNLYLNWGSTFQTILNFDMNESKTIVYGADQKYGIVKFTNNAGTWVQAPYYFSTTNIGTTNQASGNQGCFGITVDFSGANPVIYATTMENGAATNYAGGFGVNTAQGHQNNNRLIKIVDTGVSPGTTMVAQTLAIAATTNEFFGGIDFTPDLRPLITTNPASYSTIPGGGAVPFIAGVQSVYALSNQWFIIGTNTMFPSGGTNLITGETGTSIADLNADFMLDTSFNHNLIQLISTNNYGAVTSTPAILTVTTVAVAPQITSGTNNTAGLIAGGIVFPGVKATGTQPFIYQWYYAGNALADGPNPSADGSGFSGSQTASLTITNLQLAEAGSYYLVVANSAGYASNKVDVLMVNYRKASIGLGQPSSVTTFIGTPTTLNADQSGATAPVTYQWYKGTTLLSGAEYGNASGTYAGSGSAKLTINATTTSDTATNYYIVYSNGGGNVTSTLASVTVITPPAHSAVNYSNQVYTQTFNALPDPGTAGIAANGTANASGVSVNSINNTKTPGTVNGVAYSLANPFDFAYPVIFTSYIGGLGLSTGATNMIGWYGAADTNAADGVDTDPVNGNGLGLTRFGAQAGDQSTGGIIDFGPLDVNGGIVGTNRALGLLSTGSTGSTAFGLKLINTSTNTLNYITVSFLGEMWRNNKAARTMSFSYVVDPLTNSWVLQSEPTWTNSDPQIIPGTVRVPSLSFSFQTNNGSVLAVDGTLPTNQISEVASNFALATPWAPGQSLWLVWSCNYYGQGTGQGYAIDNLSFSAVASLPAVVSSPYSISPRSVHLTGGAGSAATFTFTNTPGLTFSVLATNNVSAPKTSWPVIGTAVESPANSGSYQFTDPNPATNSARFYLLRQP